MSKKAKNLWLGAHTSIAGGIQNAAYISQSIGASTAQIFTSNQKQWRGREVSQETAILWEKAIQETGIQHVMSHDSYLINLGSPHEDILQKSRTALSEELDRCHALKIPYLNLHPGSATSSTIDACIQTIVESLLSLESAILKGETRLLLETTAGQGTSVGHRFDHLAAIIEQVQHKIPIGVCIDTCHIFAAGYDIRTKAAWKNTLKEFDEVIGLKHLYAFHLNDSLKDLGTRVDRHAPLGKGKIGLEAFHFLMTHPHTQRLPKYLETPGGPPLWEQEIALLKEFSQHKEFSYADKN